MKSNYDVIIIGGGPGGLAAAIAAKENGTEDVLIIERDVELGGILLQCIHNGFGLEFFDEDMPGNHLRSIFHRQGQGAWGGNSDGHDGPSTSPPNERFTPSIRAWVILNYRPVRLCWRCSWCRY
ncbi:MAG: FAD-dependent oxidoreductase [Chloroflexota bacterium]|nr:FAD-dependent oxidoreductase [Chloroflexota bacterium]